MIRIFMVFISNIKEKIERRVFSFAKEHQEDSNSWRIHFRYLVMLVCGRDGIVCLTYEELKELLDDNFEDLEGIRIKGLWEEIII